LLGLGNQQRLETLKNYTTLYVDDDEMLLETMRPVLQHFFPKVLTAINGVEALKVLDEESVDVLITDVRMPVMDGLSLCAKIREYDNNMPIIIASSFTERQELLAAVKLNLVEYMLKPITFEGLTNALLGCVDKMEQNGRLFVILSEDTTYSSISKYVLKNGIEIFLTKKESQLLELLIRCRGQLVEHAKIDEFVYAGEEMSATAMRNLVLKLRKKVGHDIIESVGKIGYIIK